MSVSLKGQQQWESFHVLCKPPELLSIDRRLFGLLVILFAVFWQGFGQFRLGLVITVAVYFLLRRMTRQDPHFFSVLRLGTRFDVAWCDPGAPPERFGAYVLDLPLDEIEPHREEQAG